MAAGHAVATTFHWWEQWTGGSSGGGSGIRDFCGGHSSIFLELASDFLEQPDLGRLQKGCAADLVFVRGDLSQQIPERPELARVVRDGTEYAPALLLQGAETVEASWRNDPWAKQFAQHFAKRANSRT